MFHIDKPAVICVQEELQNWYGGGIRNKKKGIANMRTFKKYMYWICKMNN